MNDEAFFFGAAMGPDVALDVAEKQIAVYKTILLSLRSKII